MSTLTIVKDIGPLFSKLSGEIREKIWYCCVVQITPIQPRLLTSHPVPKFYCDRSNGSINERYCEETLVNLSLTSRSIYNEVALGYLFYLRNVFSFSSLRLASTYLGAITPNRMAQIKTINLTWSTIGSATTAQNLIVLSGCTGLHTLTVDLDSVGMSWIFGGQFRFDTRRHGMKAFLSLRIKKLNVVYNKNIDITLIKFGVWAWSRIPAGSGLVEQICLEKFRQHRTPVNQAMIDMVCQQIDAEVDRVRAIMTQPRKDDRKTVANKLTTAISLQGYNVVGSRRMEMAGQYGNAPATDSTGFPPSIYY